MKNNKRKYNIKYSIKKKIRMNLHVVYGMQINNEILSEINDNFSRSECEEEPQKKRKKMSAILIKPAKHVLKTLKNC